MSTDIDGAAILGAMVRDPSAFGMAKPQLDAIATAAVRSSLRDKNISVAVLRTIAQAIGRPDFETIIGGLPAKDARSLAGMGDSMGDSGADEPARAEQGPRSHIMRLAQAEAGSATRVPRILRAARPAASASEPAPRLSKIGKIMRSQAQATAGRARKLGSRG